MSLTKSLCLISGAALSLCGVAQAQSTNLDLSRSQASELKADALGRTSQLAPQDSKFTVEVHGYLQFRFVLNQRDSADPVLAPGDEEATWGFQNARDRINVSGNIFNESWFYFIQFGWGPDASFGTFLEDAYASYNFGNGWDLTWGKFKLPGLREELVGDTYQLAVERSATWSSFTGGRADAVQLGYETQQMRLKMAFSDGANSNNTDFNSAAEADFGLSARLDYKWNGDWKQAVDFTSFPQSPNFGMVGVAAHYQDGGSSFNTADTTVWAITADVSVEGDGWNAFGAVVYTNTDQSTGPTFTDMGLVVQGGIFVSPNWELFGRLDMIMPDEDYGAGADENFTTLTLGANNYIMPNSHAAKLTLQFSYFMDQTGQTAIVSAPNTLGSLMNSGEDGQWALTGQMQVGF